MDQPGKPFDVDELATVQRNPDLVRAAPQREFLDLRLAAQLAAVRLHPAESQFSVAFGAVVEPFT